MNEMTVRFPKSYLLSPNYITIKCKIKELTKHSGPGESQEMRIPEDMVGKKVVEFAVGDDGYCFIRLI